MAVGVIEGDAFHALTIAEALHEPLQTAVGFFREEGLSDLIGFTYSTWHGDDAANNLVHDLVEMAQGKNTAGPTHAVLIALDGENAWEYYPFNGYWFLKAMYANLASNPQLELMTLSQCLDRGIQPLPLQRVPAGSWVHGTLATWMGDAAKNQGWDLLCEAKRAFDEAKYGNFSRNPYIEMTFPSISDPSLAPAGQHVMSIYMQYAPYTLKNSDWESQRAPLCETVVKTIAQYAPNLPQTILRHQIITPKDLEETYGLTGGHIFHGELALDQFFTMRPLLDWARYRTPIERLYLCGSGTHPGTGLTGGSGANAAREIAKALKN